jgi:hypothetical protein
MGIIAAVVLALLPLSLRCFVAFIALVLYPLSC